MPRQCFNEHKK